MVEPQNPSRKTNKAKMFKYFITFFLIFTLSPNLISQDVAAWEDRQGRLQFYDDGFITQLEHQQINRFEVGGDFIIYHNNRNEVKYYRKGHEEVLHLRDVMNQYTFSQFLVLMEVGDRFDVINHKTKETLSLQNNTRFVYGDSIVAFVDLYGQFKTYYRGKIHDIDPIAPETFRASDNSFAWTDRKGWLQFYSNKETFQITDVIPNQYKVGRDFVMYLDDYDEFYIWRNGESTLIDDFPPNSWKVGDSIAAYVDEDENFMVIDQNSSEPIELLPSAPRFYDIVDNTLVYLDDANYLNVYYKGENHLLEYYEPEEIKYFNGIVAYTDDNGRLKAFYEGEIMPVSKNIVESFEVQGRVILYEYGNGDYMIFHNRRNFYQN